MRKLIVPLVTCVAALSLTANASAGIWTPRASNATQDITAVDYRAADQLYYATANGQIFKNGTQQLNVPGVSFTGIELNPAGTAGLATANNGKLYRYNGTAWTLISLANTSFNHLCPGSGSLLTRNFTPTGNLTAVSWKDDLTAYVTGADRGVVLKTTDGGTTWNDVSRQSDRTCFADPGSNLLTDVATVKNTDLVYAVTDNFGARRFSADGFAGAASARNATSVNCFDVPMKIAVDQDNPNRNYMVGKCGGGLAFGFSSDGGVTYDISLDYPNGAGSTITALYDVALVGGTALAVGDGGVILNSLDGAKAYFQPADGSEATTGWRAVDAFDANNAAVVGVGGKIVTTTAASTIPDLVPPAGTISGPVTATAGQPVAYTANLSDNVGGSGVDPASLQWSATGIPGATGNPANIVWPSAGFFTLKVAFKDRAGNAAEATLDVTVKTPAPGAGSRTLQLPGGGSITLSGPKACVPAGGSFTATLAFKKSKRKGAKTVKVSRVDFFIDGKRVKVDRRAPFRQTLTVRNLAAGTRHTLKARATIKVRRGTSPKKSVSTAFSVCP